MPFSGSITSLQLDEKEDVVLAVGRMIEDEKRFSLALKGMDSVKEFSVENVVDKWEQLFFDMKK